MTQRNGIRIVTTAVVTGLLTLGGAGLAFAQEQPSPSWQVQGNRATHALNMLESQGFPQYANFRKAGQKFTANVLRHGRWMEVTINPDTNEILSGPPMNTGA